MTIVLSTAYFPPIEYFSKLIQYENIILERYEHYPKQTYRNRCVIYGANGPLILTVPVTKGNELKVYTKDIKIDYSSNWKKIHLKAIESAYQNSPYYQYYIDDILPILDKNYTFLYDLNFQLLQNLLQITGIKINITETTEYYHHYISDICDYREIIHSNKISQNSDASFKAPIYNQVFESKHGFEPNLSILDLLFNTGPECSVFLHNSINN